MRRARRRSIGPNAPACSACAGIGRDQRNRRRRVAPLHLEQPPDRRVARGIDSKAVERVGRIGDDPAAAQDARRPRRSRSSSRLAPDRRPRRRIQISSGAGVVGFAGAGITISATRRPRSPPDAARPGGTPRGCWWHRANPEMIGLSASAGQRRGGQQTEARRRAPPRHDRARRRVGRRGRGADRDAEDRRGHEQPARSAASR